MDDTVEIRPTSPEDQGAIRALAAAAGLFSEDEAAEIITDVGTSGEGDSLWLGAVGPAGALVGAVYAGREPVSDEVWNMYFLAVDPSLHGTGVGSALVAETESRLRRRSEGPASAVVVETSSGESYAAARRFYAGRGYTQVGRVPQYYGPDEDKIIFWKLLR